MASGIGVVMSSPSRKRRCAGSIVLIRMSNDERTKAYVAKRTAEGKTIGEIAHIVKRYVAREDYPHLLSRFG